MNLPNSDTVKKVMPWVALGIVVVVGAIIMIGSCKSGSKPAPNYWSPDYPQETKSK